jgi:hypothetical protein
MKKCFKCRRNKELRLFYRHKMMADGHLNKCMACTKKDVRKHRIDKPEAIAAYELRRSKDPERKKYLAKKLIEWRAENPGKNSARQKVAGALRSGKLKRLPCEKCASSVKVQAHHEDYRKPLDVVWLCWDCHRRDEHGYHLNK